MLKRNSIAALAAYLPFATLLDMGHSSPYAPDTPKEKRKLILPLPKPPKGSIENWFRIDGTLLNEKNKERMLKTETVFKTFAINDKNTIRKFNQWKQNQSAQ